MKTEDVIEKLQDLVHLDYDAAQAYDHAIAKVDILTVRSELSVFKQDHERHITDLTRLIKALGGAPKVARDVKGYLIEGMTALQSALGTKMALKAMRTNEKLTNKVYEETLEAPLPANVRAVVERNRDDERLHLDYIERALDELDLEDEIVAGSETRGPTAR
jgi:uncharacterized protein (TIGR02284 family)